MAHLNTDVQIDGKHANLEGLSESFAVVNGVNEIHSIGEACDLVIYAEIMGKRVPIKLKGEIVQFHADKIEVMFPAPSKNWERIIRSMNKHPETDYIRN